LKETTAPESTLILGVGNVIMSDEGFGVHVTRKLIEAELPDDIRIEEGGVGGFNLLGSLEGVKRLIVIDVMLVDISPGDILFFRPGPNFSEPGKSIISFHQVGVLELVKMWRFLGNEPEIFFLVTRPQKLECGMELSTPVQAAVVKAVNLIKEISENDFAVLERSSNSCSL
jgi:hydrogenase maturation protease